MKQRLAVHVPVAVAVLAAAAVSLPAAAQTSSTTTRVTDEWRMPYQRDFWNYIGATVGRSDYDVGCVAGFPCDQKDTAFKIVAGGKLYNVLGMEIGYVHMGNADIAGGTTRAHGANLSLVAGLPIFGDRFGINGKIGGTYGWTKTRVAVPGVCVPPANCAVFRSEDERGFGLSYGVGATFAVTRNLEVRVDWDRYRFDFAGVGDEDVDMLSAGLNLRF
jgi:hypothetical protein